MDEILLVYLCGIVIVALDTVPEVCVYVKKNLISVEVKLYQTSVI